MKKNKLLLLFGLLLSVSCAYGQASYPTSLVIKRSGGKATQVFYLHNLHKITFESGKMRTIMRNNWTIPEGGLYAINEIQKCIFSNELATTKNEEILLDPANYTCLEDGNKLFIKGLEPQKMYALCIFNVAGALIHQSDSFQAFQTIDIANWAAGVYLITINNRPIKFIKQ